jgi:lysophospholipase L1-like esterase
MAGTGGPPDHARLLSDQSVIFLGDHTSPDAPGYVALVREVVERFHPELGLRLITAGSPGQSASGLSSEAMMQLLASARPDWLVVGIGLADALREPVARQRLQEFQRSEREAEQSTLDATFGPPLEAQRKDPASEPALRLENLDAFSENLRTAIARLTEARVRVCLLTTIVLGNSLEHPVNAVVSAYNDVIRQQARAAGVLLVDIEAAFRDVMDRAANYKQTVSLTGPRGELNAQGQALVARSLLTAFGVLPSGRVRGR